MVGVANGTDAITIALRGLGRRAGRRRDRARRSPSTRAPRRSRTPARGPVFCDVDPETFCVTAGDGGAGAHARHAGGDRRSTCSAASAPVDELRELLDGRGVAIARGRGAGGRRAPATGGAPGALGDAATFSFFPSKNLFCLGDGGAIATDDDAVAEHGAHPALPRLPRQEHLHRGRVELAPRRAPGRGAARDPGAARRLERAPPRARGGLRARRASASWSTLPRAARRTRSRSTTCTWSARRIPTRRRGALAEAGIAARSYYRVPVHMQPAMAAWAPAARAARHRCGRRATNLALPMGPTLGRGRRAPGGRARCARPAADADLAANSGLHVRPELHEAGGSARKLRKMRKAVTDPVYRHRLLQLLADAVLVALAYWLAFALRFDQGIPDRYSDLLWQTIAFVIGRQGGDLRRLRPLPEVVALRRPARLRVDPEGGRGREPRDGRRAVRVVADRQRPAALDRGDGPAADGRADRRRRGSRSAACSSARRAARCCRRARRC